MKKKEPKIKGQKVSATDLALGKGIRYLDMYDMYLWEDEAIEDEYAPDLAGEMMALEDHLRGV